jgi:hypothetical protein
MSHSKHERGYLPSVPSPLNPAICPDCSRTKKQQEHPRPRPVARQSPTLSYAQHILRAKAAEAWRSEALRRGYQSVDERYVTDNSPLSRAALDMHRDTEAQTVVDLEGSFGLEPISSPPNVAEKPAFGILQPFTVDLTHATTTTTTGNDFRPRQAEDDGTQQQRCKGLTRRVLLVLGLLCLSYCLLPVRHRPTFRQGGFLHS